MNILITGSNRGIGLGLVRAYISKGAYVIATCRTLENAEELETLRNSHGDQLKILQLDVKKHKQLVSLDEELGDLSIDILYLNAGITGGRKAVPFGDLESQEWSEVLMVNSIAPILVAQRMLPRIRRSGSKTIAILTSQMGSIGNNTTGGSYIYRSSKAALNAGAKSMAHDLKNEGVKVVLLHPGWVQTDMGGPNAEITVEQSVAGMITHIERLRIDESGSFLNYRGEKLPW